MAVAKDAPLAEAPQGHGHAHEQGHGHGAHNATGAALAKLALGALGVVYGDIGTSPLYSVKECFARATPEHPDGASLAPVFGNVLGILSLIFWALTLVVTLKYL